MYDSLKSATNGLEAKLHGERESFERHISTSQKEIEDLEQISPLNNIQLNTTLQTNNLQTHLIYHTFYLNLSNLHNFDTNFQPTHQTKIITISDYTKRKYIFT